MGKAGIGGEERNKSVLLVDFKIQHGGGQQKLVDMAAALSRNGIKCGALVARNGWLFQVLNTLDTRGVALVTRCDGKAAVKRICRAIAIFLALLANHRSIRSVNVLVVNDPEAYVPAALVGILFQVDVLLYIHMAYKGISLRALCLSASSPAVRRLICCSEFVQGYLEKSGCKHVAQKTVAVENSISRDYLSQVSHINECKPRSRKRVAVIGRIVPEKGQDILMQLGREMPDTQFFVIGGFSDADIRYLEGLRAQCPENVVFAGYMDNVVEFLEDQDIGVVVVPSRCDEAFGLVAIEACASFAVVVVRRRGGLLDIANALNLRSGDTDDEILVLIREVQKLDSQEVYSSLAISYSKALQRYGPTRYEQQIVDLVNEYVQ